MEEENEIWKPVVGYEGLYEISSLGRVKGLERLDSRNHTIKGVIRKGSPMTNGYKGIVLYKNGNTKSTCIHRLVAEAFIPNDSPKFKTDINHKNENKHDNRVENLEWCTRKYNINYGTHNERANKSKINGKGSKPVLQFDLNNNFIQEFPSTREVKRALGFASCHISECCNGRRKTANGFIWKYKNKEG